MSSIRASKLCLVLAATLIADPVAQAQTASKDAAMAETLFEAAKKQMASGDYAGACPKLAESYRLDPGSGTLTALAVCHEQIGKTASAWAEFVEVVSEAQRAGRADRQKFAREHANALEPELSRLTISVAPETAQLADLEVRRDAIVVGQAAWGVAAPIDPGDHVVEATAPGKKTWSTHISVGPNADAQTVLVPALEEGPPASSDSASSSASPGWNGSSSEPAAPGAGSASGTAEAPEASAASGSGNSQRAAGWLVVGGGAVALGLGSYFGLAAIAKSKDAKQSCSPSSCTDAAAVQENGTAKTDALLSDVALGFGLLAIGVGTYLVLTAPSRASDPPASTDPGGSSQRRLRFVPFVGRSTAGLGAQAMW